MMVAKAQLACAHRVARSEHLAPLGRGTLVGAAQAAQRKVDPFARSLALDRRETFRDDQLVRDAEQRIEHAGAGRVRIFAHPQDAREAALGRSAHLNRVETEADPRIRDVEPEILIAARQQDRSGLAIVKRRQQFERLRTHPDRRFIGRQHTRAIGLQRGDQRGGRSIERKHFATASPFGLARAQLAHPLGQARLAARRANDDRQILLVDEQALAIELLGPPAVDFG